MKYKNIVTTIKRWGKRLADLQENGSPIKPMTFEPMTCKHCGTTYQGNYCPRCGQSRVVSQITSVPSWKPTHSWQAHSFARYSNCSIALAT